tara:strand:- start:5153 stop:5902 length:750 start_codon:yes stop_codon:yes gene_type:complete
MVVDFPLYGESCTLAITVWGEGDTPIRLIVEDAENSETMLTNRTGTVNGLKTYYVRIPVAPDVALIEVVCEDGRDSGYGIEDIEIMSLPTDYSHKHFQNKEAQSFINFAEEFCYNAGSIKTGAEYSSDDDIFRIKYLDDIRDLGKVVATPARISQSDGLIEVSKADFLRYTVPMRMAILLHEFSHYYLNEVMEDEIEADRNSLHLYLGMGYPRIDAYNVYLDVFENSPSELNVGRYEALNNIFKQNYKG